jgi:hypothetical protein
MVYKDGKYGCKPKFKHGSIQGAMEEAQRLAEKFPTFKILVVEVIGCVEMKDGGIRVGEAI